MIIHYILSLPISKGGAVLNLRCPSEGHYTINYEVENDIFRISRTAIIILHILPSLALPRSQDQGWQKHKPLRQ